MFKLYEASWDYTNPEHTQYTSKKKKSFYLIKKESIDEVYVKVFNPSHDPSGEDLYDVSLLVNGKFTNDIVMTKEEYEGLLQKIEARVLLKVE